MAKRFARTFRVFVSSTFSDLAVERDLLHDRVFPALARECEQQGTAFEPVDLRWGIGREAALDHSTLEICLDEVRRCQDVSPRPNFLILLGDRYGWRPPPRRIPQPHFERLLAHMDEPARTLVTQWYLLDENASAEHAGAASGELLLTPRLGRFQSESVWVQEERALVSALERASLASGLKSPTFSASATEQEILVGALALADAREHVFCVLRTLRNLDDLTRDAATTVAARTYLDVLPDGTPDVEAHRRLAALKATLAKRLGRRVRQIPARWNGSAIVLENPDEFCEQVLRALRGVIARETRRLQRPSPAVEERRLHAAFADRIRRDFVGRDDEVRRVLAHVRGEEPHPLFVYGEGGSGKSALMAHVAGSVRRVLPDVSVFDYYVGATPRSKGLRELLTALCTHVGRLLDTGVVPAGTVNDLAFEFRQRIEALPRNRPLVILLDAIDQVEAERGIDEPWWLPMTTPSHVRVVASGSSDHAHAYFRARVPVSGFLPLVPLERAAGRELVRRWLASDQRRLQPHQEQELLDKFQAVGNPLYLRLAYEEARGWRSFDPPDETVLEARLDGLMSSLLGRLSRESAHGRILVERAVSLLYAATHGLTETEMLRLLSRDPAVMAEQRQRSPWSPHTEQLPFIVWSRLRSDLAPQLQDREIGGIRRLAFFHHAFARAVGNRYLHGRIARTRVHRALAGYFGEQPLWLAGGDRVVNRRVVEELPFQELMGLRWELAEARLCQLDFVEAKHQAGLAGDLQRDYESAVLSLESRGRPTERTREYQDFCATYQHIFANDSSVVVPFAYNFADAGAVSTAAGALLNDVGWQRRPWVLLEERSPLIRRRALKAVAVGHQGAVTSVALDYTGRIMLSGGSDGTARIWDVRSGFQRLAIAAHGHFGVNAVALSRDGTVAVTGGEDGLVRAWDALTGAERVTIRAERNAVLGVATNRNGDLVAAAGTDGVIRVWRGSSELPWRTLEGHFGPVACLAMDADGLRLCSGGWDQTVRVWNLATSAVEHCHEGHRTRILGVAMTPDGSVVASASGFPDPAGGLGKNLNDSEMRVWRGDRCDVTATHGAWLRGGLSGVWGSAVFSVALDADGRRAISGGFDRKVAVWDLARESLANALNFHTDRVRAVATDLTGTTAASGGDDGLIAIWDVEGESRELPGDTPTRVRLGRGDRKEPLRTAGLLWRNKRLRNVFIIPGVSALLGSALTALAWSTGLGALTAGAAASTALFCGAILYGLYWRKETVYDPHGWRWGRSTRMLELARSLTALPAAGFSRVFKCPMCAEPIAGRRAWLQCWKCGWRDVGLFRGFRKGNV